MYFYFGGVVLLFFGGYIFWGFLWLFFVYFVCVFRVILIFFYLGFSRWFVRGSFGLCVLGWGCFLKS